MFSFKRGPVCLYQGWVLCVFLLIAVFGCQYCAIDCLGSLFTEVTRYVSSGTLSDAITVHVSATKRSASTAESIHLHVNADRP